MMAHEKGPTAVGVLVVVAALAAGGCAAESAPGGEGTITGSFDGRAFDQVGASYRIGAPDDPDRTIVVYIFDRAIACDEISDEGWDEVVADSTQSLEMKLVGTASGEYVVAVGPSLGKGDASVNYTLTSTSGTPSEVSAVSGKVILDSVDDGGGARGSFDLTFPSGDALSGTFASTSCADGKEP